MRLPLFPSVSARSGTSTKGARAVNVVRDKEITQKRPALVFSNGYGGLGNGLMETPNGLFSAWDSAIVDETGEAYIVGSGTLDGLIVAGWTDLFITGMSDDGQTCCGYGTKAAVGVRAILLTSTTLTELTYPTGVTGATRALSISGDGSTVVGSGYVTATGLMRAYKWVDGVATQITVATTSWPSGGAFGVNYDGSVICGHVVRSGVMSGFISRNSTVSYVSLSAPYTSTIELYSVSSNGAWVGGFARSTATAQQHSLIYDGSTAVFPDQTTSSVVTGLSNDGTFSCGIYNSGGTSFFYNKATNSLTSLANAPSSIYAYAISRYGNAVIGERVTAVGTVTLFRWTDGAFSLLGRISETGTGTGPAGSAAEPKAGGCSGMGTTIAVTQFDGGTRTPAFWTPN